MLPALCLLLAIFAHWTGPSSAASDSNPGGDIRVFTAFSVDRVRPGDRVAVAVVVDIDPGLHINADARQLKPIADFEPFPTELSVVSAPPGVVGELPQYPEAHPVKFDFVDDALMVFDGRVVIYLPIQIDRQFDADELALELRLAYQACGDDFCLLPERQTHRISLPAVSVEAPVTEVNEDIFAEYPRRYAVSDTGDSVTFDLFGLAFTISAAGKTGMLPVVLIAALGGLLLNVTPCVLPMIPIKIMSLAHAASNRRRCAALGAATFAGVVAFWAVLGSLIAFASGFTAANQLFQYPLFTITVGIVIAAMGLGMFGAFSLRLPQAVYRLNPRQDTLAGSFGIGILTAVMSTPCTAPFMGAAAAFAITQSSLATLTTFAAIGSGMGIPYLLLAVYPALIKHLPGSGPAGELVKQIMGLLVLAAAAYFIGVGLTALMTPPGHPAGKWYWWPVAAICAAAGSWLAIRSFRGTFTRHGRWTLAPIGAALMALSVWGGMRLTDRGPIDWAVYSEQMLQEAMAENKVVVLVFTAEWCLNCKAIETNVFSDNRIVSLLSRPDVAPVKVDLTGSNAAGKSKLRELGHLTIPLVVVFAPDRNPVFKSDFYTAAQLARAVEQALKSPEAAGEK